VEGLSLPFGNEMAGTWGRHCKETGFRNNDSLSEKNHIL
jgi:hypothetical protein